jgi:hypothetical protein
MRSSKEDAMNKISRLAVICASIAFITPGAGAGQLEGIIQTDEFLAASFKELKTQVTPKDVFSDVPECGIVDALPFRPYALPEAILLLEPCLKTLSALYDVELSAKADMDRGILIEARRVYGTPVLKNLDRSLNIRDQRLMGFPVLVRSRSVVQEALDRCFLPMVVREIESSEDFLRFYGGCLKQDAVLQVRSIGPAVGRDFAVALVSSAKSPVLEGLNGDVVVNAGSGPVKIAVLAYPALDE